MVKKRNNTLKKVLFSTVLGVIGLYFLVRFLNNSKSTDLQTLLQNLPKEVSQSINNAASKQNSDTDIIAKFDALAKEIRLNQEEQIKQLDKQRRIFEKKLQELKQAPTGATLREKLATIFEYDSSAKFPAFIWQLTKNLPQQDQEDNDNNNNNQLPEEFRVWDDKNPGFVHEVLDDNIMIAFVRHFYANVPEVIEAFETLPSTILKIDFFKYLILLARGGVYADKDTIPLQPIPNWIPESVRPSDIGLIIGVEHDASSKDWKNMYVRRLQFSTWVIQAKPGHPVIREVVSRITEATLQRKKDNDLNVNVRNDLNIMSWTGSGIWTDVIFSYFNNPIQSSINRKVTWKEFRAISSAKQLSDILVFPSFSFNAPEQMSDEDTNKALYFTIHKAEKSWKVLPKVE
ncbi:hypothetical protein TBLA_0B10090 [Henningerozyma blattae CBS 6284]|uniref:Alpha-1,6-mannosyltransferase n=1 Tax=Henningerozyma blattae (strain ATCC 34711 / CBS 6284 / DSM 70876 / NBRC 10599 / NRRL Y-10934 / UCD 77-7) TaxID=1071380 RepID=I2H0C4_HENB6|nr:hypothetical protein TBLA_0B10090 [Tetrapisispora blattae CBS 6284]CCH59826.1 hypothetical protein TBLA_0B10090 [Tetrapisispora blattae CBS 6284]